jgi:hypothetical protein
VVVVSIVMVDRVVVSFILTLSLSLSLTPTTTLTLEAG